jgi:site-specific DNA-cytosine methylase
VDERDIREILKSEEATDNFLSQAGLKREDVDVLEGSPPCCEFSTAGKGISDQSKMRAYSDVRQKNIASLPFDFVDLALRTGPKVVICENVPAFATRARAIFESVLQSLRYGSGSGSRAYYVNCSVLSASSFGVPQRRRRLFIVGVRRDVAESVGIHDDDGVRAVFPAGSHTELSIRSAFTNLEQSPAHVWPWAELAMTSSLGPLIRKLPKSPARWTRLGHVMPNVRENFTLTRCSWDLPAPTLTVFGQAPNQMSGAIHPEQDRKFTIPELKRLFALPDDFILTGTLSQGAERICRMVPPPLTKAIAERVYERVLKPFKERS